jgi:hypothetical protein
MAALMVLAIAVLLHGFMSGDRGLSQRAKLVGQLGLTDLALFTEARYTRHPSQADLHSAFQDHPMSFDHFPTGSLIAAPLQNFNTRAASSTDEAKK